MNYEKTKEISFRHYPRLYLHEDDLLHALFFVNGNGYDWFNGELVYLTYDDNDNPREVTEAELDEQNKFHREQMYQSKLESNRDWQKIWVEITGKERDFVDPDPYYELPAKEIEYRESSFEIVRAESQCWFRVEGSERHRFGHKMYPICKYAMIMNLPDNIQPDWLGAADRALQWAEGPYCRTNQEDREHLAVAKQRIAELKALK